MKGFHCEVCGVPVTDAERASRWVMIKAHDAGWYQMRDGRIWCPAHRPKWAPAFPKP